MSGKIETTGYRLVWETNGRKTVVLVKHSDGNGWYLRGCEDYPVCSYYPDRYYETPEEATEAASELAATLAALGEEQRVLSARFQEVFDRLAWWTPDEWRRTFDPEREAHG